MDWRYTPYTLLLLAASAVAVALVLYVWRRREAPGAGMVILMLGAVFAWSLGYAFELGRAGSASRSSGRRSSTWGSPRCPRPGWSSRCATRAATAG